jgi:hypothetical protein
MPKILLSAVQDKALKEALAVCRDLENQIPSHTSEDETEFTISDVETLIEAFRFLLNASITSGTYKVR